MSLRHLVFPLALFLAPLVVLTAQELRPISAPPSLPFGLTWTMSEREVLAALKREGVSVEMTQRGQSRSEAQIQEMTRYAQGDDDDKRRLAQALRDEKTWRVYVAESVVADSELPTGQLRIEMLHDRILKVWVAVKTESDSQHLVLAHLLDDRYRPLYGTNPVGSWKEMPRFPSGQALAFMEKIEQPKNPRPTIFYGWSGRVGKVMYGTTIYTSFSDQTLVLLHERGDAPKPASTQTGSR